MNERMMQFAYVKLSTVTKDQKNNKDNIKVTKFIVNVRGGRWTNYTNSPLLYSAPAYDITPVLATNYLFVYNKSAKCLIILNLMLIVTNVDIIKSILVYEICAVSLTLAFFYFFE